MRFLIIFLAILACPSACFSYNFGTYNPSSITGGFQSTSGMYNNYPRVTQIEQSLFNRNYDGEDVYIRLARLERKLFKTTYQNADLNWRVENILANIDTSSMYNISSNELSSVEQRVLGRRYPKDKLENRLSRLETQMFGTIQGGRLDERYELIRKSAMNYNSIASASTPYGGYYSQGYTGGGIKNTLKNILGSMAGSAMPFGVMTGFTPPITSSPYCYDPYNYGSNMNSGLNQWYRSNTGYYNQNSSFGTGSGVTILDN